jgi:mRNA interferase RelE/StbE
MRRVTIQWTLTAKNGLAKLPHKVRRGLLDKANQLRNVDDPSVVHKPLTGPLNGYYRIAYSRYRAIYSVEEEKLANGDVVVRIIVRFVAVGIRKEGDKNDIYRFAQKLFQMGALDAPGEEEAEEGDEKQ